MKKIKTTVCIITAVLALTLALPAHAEGFRQGDKSDEIAAVQSVLKSKKLYSGEVNGLFDRLFNRICCEKNAANGRIQPWKRQQFF